MRAFRSCAELTNQISLTGLPKAISAFQIECGLNLSINNRLPIYRRTPRAHKIEQAQNN
jgi:hypothetical protein